MKNFSYLLIAAFCSAGCVDPGARFDDFVGRWRASGTEAGSPGNDAATCTIHPGALAGTYLLAISVALAPTKPIVAISDVSSPVLDAGVGIALDVQPLLASDRKTPVDQKIALGPFPIDSDGNFRASVPGLQVSGAANPITGGDITADLVLSGNLCGDGRFFCGTITGNVQKPSPLPLKGTFTLIRLDTPSDIPARPAIDFTGALADPL